MPAGPGVRYVLLAAFAGSGQDGAGLRRRDNRSAIGDRVSKFDCDRIERPPRSNAFEHQSWMYADPSSRYDPPLASH